MKRILREGQNTALRGNGATDPAGPKLFWARPELSHRIFRFEGGGSSRRNLAAPSPAQASNQACEVQQLKQGRGKRGHVGKRGRVEH